MFADREPADHKPSVADWDPVVDALNTAVDRLGDVASVIAASHGGKLTIPPRPRPETAIDRARQRRIEQQRHALTKRLLPN